MTMTIDMPAEQYERLVKLARDRGLSAEELARRGLDEMMSRDDAFQAAAAHVLQKNAELYRRLAK